MLHSYVCDYIFWLTEIKVINVNDLICFYIIYVLRIIIISFIYLKHYLFKITSAYKQIEISI